LIEALKQYEHQYSVFPFGEFVHYTDQRDEFDVNELRSYLNSQNLSEITISKTKPTIEDSFMELAES